MLTLQFLEGIIFTKNEERGWSLNSMNTTWNMKVGYDNESGSCKLDQRKSFVKAQPKKLLRKGQMWVQTVLSTEKDSQN